MGNFTDYEAWQAETERRLYLLSNMEKLAEVITRFIRKGYFCFGLEDGKNEKEPWEDFKSMISYFFPPPNSFGLQSLYEEFNGIYTRAETALAVDNAPVIKSLEAELNRAACSKIFIDCELELKPEYIEGEQWEAVEYLDGRKRLFKIVSTADGNTLDDNYGKGYKREDAAVGNYKKIIKIYKMFQKMPELYQFFYENEAEYAAGNLTEGSVIDWLDERGYFSRFKIDRLFMLARPDGELVRRYIGGQ